MWLRCAFCNGKISKIDVRGEDSPTGDCGCVPLTSPPAPPVPTPVQTEREYMEKARGIARTAVDCAHGACLRDLMCWRHEVIATEIAAALASTALQAARGERELLSRIECSACADSLPLTANDHDHVWNGELLRCAAWRYRDKEFRETFSAIRAMPATGKE